MSRAAVGWGVALPYTHLLGGLARWVAAVAGLGEDAVLLEDPAGSMGPGVPYVTLTRLAVAWAGTPAEYYRKGPTTWTLDFGAPWAADEGAAVDLGGVVVEAAAGVDGEAVRAAWVGAVVDRRLGEVVTVAAVGAEGASVELVAGAPAGLYAVEGVRGVDVTAGAAGGPYKTVCQAGTYTLRVTAVGFADVGAAEAVLGRIRAATGSRTWATVSRAWLGGALGVVVGAGDVTAAAARTGATFDTRAYVDVRVAVVDRTGLGAEDALAAGTAAVITLDTWA